MANTSVVHVLKPVLGQSRDGFVQCDLVVSGEEPPPLLRSSALPGAGQGKL